MDKIRIKHCTSFICNGSQIQNDIPQLEGLRFLKKEEEKRKKERKKLVNIYSFWVFI